MISCRLIPVVALSAPFVAVSALTAGAGPTRAQSLSANDEAFALRTFHANPRQGNSLIVIFSAAELEDFAGMVNRVGGQVRVDPAHPETLRASLSFRCEDLKTGIGLRDRHLLGPSWLDASSHPQISVDIRDVRDVTREDESTAEMTLLGTCTIRGKQNPIRAACTFTYMPETDRTMKREKGDLVRLRARFSVKLSDYGIEGPPGSGVIPLKVADRIDIHAAVYASSEPPPAPLEADTEEAQDAPAVPPPPPPSDDREP